MLPIHTVLHPTDFSDRSRNALLLACALANDYGARLIVLHVAWTAPLVSGEGMLPTDPDLIRRAAMEELERLEVPAAGGAFVRRFEEGDAVAAILRVAQEVPADLIVMGTHGRTGLGRLLMGSVAEQVVRKAPCPVLTVKTPFLEASPSSGASLAESSVALGVSGP